MNGRIIAFIFVPMRLAFRHIKWLPMLMGITILAIVAFQVYWLRKAYEREKRTMEIRTNITFRETVLSLQAAKLKLDKLSGDSSHSLNIEINKTPTKVFKPMGEEGMPPEKVFSMINVVRNKVKDSSRGILIVRGDTLKQRSGSWQRNRLMQFLVDMDSLQDSVRIKEIVPAFQKNLDEQNIEVPFTVSRYIPNNANAIEPKFNEAIIGFKNPIVYKLNLGNTFPYLIKKIITPIIFTLFLIAITIVSFSLVYRSLLNERRLAEIKNEFISNITHELKTPIATVSVAIEALRSFGGSVDPQKTKEYLTISANELQRLSLLVDKVLKLSMIEKKEIELKYEQLDMRGLVDEVTSSMRLQFEKHGAEVNVRAEGDMHLEGDRLHLVSVLFNLFDNAIKYSNGNPHINVLIKGDDNSLSLIMSDNGIGVPEEYREKVFEKFFRVPTGNLHNAKGYGLGLSYVSHVVDKHGGSIKVVGNAENGSDFIINLPKHQA
jgi:two-component system phosphate regulon sensor histidine kinase PhoR